MIRFVDLRNADIAGSRFAFFDTVPDRFVELHDEQAFDDWADFEELFKGSGYQDLERFRGLCPEWVFLKAANAEDQPAKQGTSGAGADIREALEFLRGCIDDGQDVADSYIKPALVVLAELESQVGNLTKESIAYGKQVAEGRRQVGNLKEALVTHSDKLDLATQAIDRLTRERTEAWDQGYECAVNHRGVILEGIDPNPYRSST